MTSTADPAVLRGWVDESTGRLLAGTAAITDARAREPSLLPGWTRGHLLTHLARNADGLCNLLTWARTGVMTPQYPSAAARDEDIEAGAGRSAAELHADVADGDFSMTMHWSNGGITPYNMYQGWLGGSSFAAAAAILP